MRRGLIGAFCGLAVVAALCATAAWSASSGTTYRPNLRLGTATPLVVGSISNYPLGGFASLPTAPFALNVENDLSLSIVFTRQTQGATATFAQNLNPIFHAGVLEPDSTMKLNVILNAPSSVAGVKVSIQSAKAVAVNVLGDAILGSFAPVSAADIQALFSAASGTPAPLVTAIRDKVIDALVKHEISSPKAIARLTKLLIQIGTNRAYRTWFIKHLGKKFAPVSVARAAAASAEVVGAYWGLAKGGWPGEHTLKVSLLPKTTSYGHVYWVNYGDGTPADGTVNTVPVGGGSATTLASGLESPTALAVDGTQVYWVEDAGTVNKVPVGGGAVTTLASGQDRPSGVAVDGTHVYWTNVFGETVNEVPIGGGTVTALATGQSRPWPVAVDGTNVYWGVSDPNAPRSGAVYEAPLGGGEATTLYNGPYIPTSLAVDGTHVYWASDSTAYGGYGPYGTVNEVPVGGGTVTTLASGQDLPASVAVDGTHVYWVSRGEWGPHGTVNEVSGGGGTVTILASGQAYPVSVAVDGTHVYWVNGGENGTDGTVNEVTVGGGPVTTLATGQNNPYSLAVGP